MDRIDLKNCSKIIYIPEGNRVHKLYVTYLPDEDEDKFEKQNNDKQPPKKKNNGLLGQITSIVKKPVETIKNCFGKKSADKKTTETKEEKLPAKKHPRMHIFICRDATPLFEQPIAEQPQIVYPYNSAEISPMQNYSPVNESQNYEKEFEVPNAETMMTIKTKKGRELSQREQERINSVKERITPDNNALIKNINGSIISQSNKKITLTHEGKSISVELKKNKQNEDYLELGYLDEDKNNAVYADLLKSGMLAGSSSRVADFKELQFMLNGALQMAQQEFNSDFDYDTAGNIIENFNYSLTRRREF